MFLSDTKIIPAGHRFDVDVDHSSGLSLRVRGGVYLDGTGLKSAPNATLTLTASTTNYVEMNDAGVVSTNTTGFTAGATALYIITTGASVITGLKDCRDLSTHGAYADGYGVANVADANLYGGIPVLHQYAIANQASGNIDIALIHKTKIADAWIVKGAAGHATEDTIKLQNVTTDITAALVMANVANALKRFVSMDEAQTTIAAGANLRAVLVRGAGGGNNTACTLYVLGVRVA